METKQERTERLVKEMRDLLAEVKVEEADCEQCKALAAVTDGMQRVCRYHARIRRALAL